MLDSLEAQVHDGVPAFELPETVRLIVGDVRDRGPRRDALAGVDARRASRRGGRRRPVDVRDRPLHRAQHDGDGGLPRAAWSPPATGCRQAGRRLVDVDLRRGRLRLPDRRRARRRPRGPRSSSLARQWELRCPACGAEPAPVGTPETKPLIPTSIYAIGKRDHEEMCLVTGAAYGDPGGRAALLQRLRAAPGALQPLHGRRRDLRLAAAQRPPPVIFEDGSRAATSSTSPTSSAAITAALESGAAAGQALNLGTGPARSACSRSPRCSAPGSASSIEPESSAASTGPGDIRHCVRRSRARPGAARLRGPASLEDGMRGAARVARRARTPWTGWTRRPRTGRARARPLTSVEAVTYLDDSAVADLAIVIVSTNEAHWLDGACGRSIEHAGHSRPSM